MGGAIVPGVTGSVVSSATNRRSFVGQATINPTTAGPVNTGPSAKIRLVPHLENTRSLRFEPISKELKPGDPPLRIGRFTDRHNTAASANRLAFKSKVVSRGHAEVWLDDGLVSDTRFVIGVFSSDHRSSI